MAHANPSWALAARLSPQQLREARRRLIAEGSLPESLPIAPQLQASWQRSQRFGLQPDVRAPGAPHASAQQLARALEHRRAFVAQARPVMEFVFEQIRDSENLVILADAQGMLLEALGEPVFADKAARVALRPGAIWHEQWRGTNAIGTALADGHAVVVHGAEHFLERNAFLTCAAAPIVDPAGRLLGVLDISGDHRSYHRHTLGLVRSATRMIEHQLFEARHGSELRLHLHARAEGLGTVAEGLLALSEDGWIVGANTAALELLRLPRSAIGALPLEQALGLELRTLLAQGRAPRSVQLADGRTLWLRLEPGRSGLTLPAGAALRPAAAARDALAALDSGDAALQGQIERARRVIDKPIALLLQGESGVGKELFARACHDSSARHGKPFVALNCAALPEGLIEAELFGYRPGAFTGAARDGAPGRLREAQGGTLFLDEIGDMPLALQARLLRVLQERQVQPLGGGAAVPVDFALICATHRPLRQEVEAGRFREDLYYRVNGLALRLPPLRERSDLAALVERLLSELAPGRGLALAEGLLQDFRRYRWPGNVRQLANALRTACALLGDEETLITHAQLPEDLLDELRASTPLAARTVQDEDADLRVQAQRSIERVLQDCQGNVTEAARRLGISRNTLYRKLRGSANSGSSA